jgi:hypothetical protein
VPKVLCLIKTVWTNIDEEELWLDLDPTSRSSKKKELYLPLYDHPHNDIENGQKEIHYHQDTRYIGEDNMSDFHSFRNGRIGLPLINGETLGYKTLTKIREEELFKTPVKMISKSKLKHKCIHKGKCPHRGYPLSDVVPKDGVITCPLHSLKFDSITKQLI